MPPSSPLQVGHKVRSHKGYVQCVSSRLRLKNLTKFEWRPFFLTLHLILGENSDQIWVKTFFLLFTWFWAKIRTKFRWNNFCFRSLFLPNFLKFLASPFSKSCVRCCSSHYIGWLFTRGGVEDTRLEAKAKDSLSEDRHSRGQGQECSRPRPRTKDTSASALQKKKRCPRAEDRPIFEDLRTRGQGLQNVSSRPRTSSRTPPLLFTIGFLYWATKLAIYTCICFVNVQQ